MAGPTRISQLTDGSPVQPTDQVPVARGSGATGYTYKVNAGRIVSDLFNVANTPSVNLTFDTSTRTLSAVANIPDSSVNVVDSPTIDLDWNASTRTLSADVTTAVKNASAFNVVDSPTIDLDWNASTRTLSATTSIVPVGSVMAFPSTTAPSGWIKLNGASLSRSVYSNLWAFAQASGNLVTDTAWYSTSATGSFSQGDGFTTFRLPDFRGEFVRAWDDSRGIDSGRGIGVWQTGSLIVGDIDGSTGDTLYATGMRIGGGLTGANRFGWDIYRNTEYVDQANFQYLAAADENQDISGFSSLNTGVTRPRNIPLLYCIKF